MSCNIRQTGGAFPLFRSSRAPVCGLRPVARRSPVLPRLLRLSAVSPQLLRPSRVLHPVAPRAPFGCPVFSQSSSGCLRCLALSAPRRPHHDPAHPSTSDVSQHSAADVVSDHRCGVWVEASDRHRSDASHLSGYAVFAEGSDLGASLGQDARSGVTRRCLHSLLFIGKIHHLPAKFLFPKV